ncbi:tetratricopeptide repeat protein [Sphingorhabdus sp.]|uniref:tetratricopeptide repeat protein n=1 Tax=Sphingorhabdus sp. TaxID=1902408 RepID=UPI0038FC5E27
MEFSIEGICSNDIAKQRQGIRGMHLVGIFILIVAVVAFLGVGDSRQLVGGCLSIVFIIVLIIAGVASCSKKDENSSTEVAQDVATDVNLGNAAVESYPAPDTSLEDANQLFENSNYHEAALIYKKLGHSADGLVESRIAWMYYTGEGISQNKEKSYALYAKAARLGNADAQAMLGQFYANGEHYAKNLVQGYIWSLVAKSQGNKIASDNKENIEKQMSVSETIEAQNIATNCEKSHYKECKYVAKNIPPEIEAAQNINIDYSIPISQ